MHMQVINRSFRGCDVVEICRGTKLVSCVGRLHVRQSPFLDGFVQFPDDPLLDLLCSLVLALQRGTQESHRQAYLGSGDRSNSHTPAAHNDVAHMRVRCESVSAAVEEPASLLEDDRTGLQSVSDRSQSWYMWTYRHVPSPHAVVPVNVALACSNEREVAGARARRCVVSHEHRVSAPHAHSSAHDTSCRLRRRGQGRPRA